ncbi:MAG: hypothetical protein KF732_07120 [Flavobacteriales bacterium]|nr:hypothetical protein [Flavobacteriales bacterium]MBX2959715.1 hypothetical protein [Flavobacteriales bacterium]
MKNILILILIIFISSCTIAQQSTKPTVKTSFVYSDDVDWGNLKEVMKVDTTINETTFYFMSGFNDSIYVKYKDVIIFNDFVETDFSTSYSGKAFNINYDEKEKEQKINIYFNKKKSQINIDIIHGFRFVKLHKNKDNGIWDVIYSNVVPTFE